MKQKIFPQVGTIAQIGNQRRIVTESPASFRTINFTVETHHKEHYPAWCYLNDWYRWLKGADVEHR